MKIFKRIRLVYLAAAISMAVLVVFGLLYMVKSRDQVKYIDAVEHTYKILSAVNHCERTLIDAEAAQRGFLLTGEESYRDLFEATLPSIDSSLAVTGKFLSDSAGQNIYFIQLQKFVLAKKALMQQNLSVKGEDPLYFDFLRRSAVLMENCRYYMSKIRQREETLLQLHVEEKNRYQRLNLTFFKATFISACFICVAAIVVFFRELGIRLTAQQDLKMKISELGKSKQELEEITYAASHDLQEPMRKLRVFSNLFAKKFADKLPADDLEIVSRISRVTEQMHQLLNDVVNYTNLLNPNEKFSGVKLYDVFREVYEKVLQHEDVHFQIQQDLPVINGSRKQLEIMLIHLLENSLKFKAADRPLVITISYEPVEARSRKKFWEFQSAKNFHQVTITDNGIGFEKQYNEKIFGLFQRLHTQSAYPGKGIGLSVARRVMVNHGGTISSDAGDAGGASFILQFPAFDND